MRDIVLPRADERNVHGNASFESAYFLRAAAQAADSEGGLALVHSHPGARGWQATSADDERTEKDHARQAFAITGLPLLGMTSSTGDQAWSARMWHPERGCMDRTDAASVRVAGDRLRVTLHPAHVREHYDERLDRTVTAWGPDVQQLLGHLRVGVIGAGSVGAIVA